MKLRNPGWPTLAILALLIGVSVLMHVTKAADAAKFTAEVISLTFGTLVARSAIAAKPKDPKLPPPHPRAPMRTWPDLDDAPDTTPEEGEKR